MRNAASLHRSTCAIVFAVLLALRTLGSVGYMPQLDHGRLTVMLCPDGEWASPAAPMAGMDRHQGSSHDQRQCPYAAAAAIPFAAGSTPVVPVPLLTFALFGLVVGECLLVRSRFERPKQTGPPIPA